MHLVLCLNYRVDRQLQQLVREVYMALVDQAMMVTNPCMYVDTLYRFAAVRLWLALMIDELTADERNTVECPSSKF